MKQAQKSKALSLLTSVAICTFIFSNSLRSGESSSEQSNAVLKMVNGLLGELGVGRLGGLMLRKAAHFLEFWTLGISLTVTVRCWMPSLMLRRQLLVALSLGGLCAAFDEFLQLFSPGRAAQLADMLLDCAGVLAGVLLMAAVRSSRKKAGRIRTDPRIKKQGD